MRLFDPNVMLCRSLMQPDLIIGVSMTDRQAIESTQVMGELWTTVKTFRPDGKKLHVGPSRNVPVAEINEENFYVIDPGYYEMLCYSSR